LAKTVDEIKSSTKIAGTWNYISPECINKIKITCASDIWSFGCVFYELVKLEKAFDAKTEFGVMTAIVNNPIPQLQIDKFQKILLK
jgi:serine/threonine protein kinase